jgi:hypothetical protein
MPHHTATGPESNRMTRSAGALLCLAVAVIHVIDQGGITATRDPRYIGVAYHVLEITAVLTALLLLAGLVRPGWLLSVGVAVGPLLGYVLSRGPGLPGYQDDIGNWTEPLGLASLAVEAALLLLALPLLVRSTRWTPGSSALASAALRTRPGPRPRPARTRGRGGDGLDQGPPVCPFRGIGLLTQPRPVLRANDRAGRVAAPVRAPLPPACPRWDLLCGADRCHMGTAPAHSAHAYLDR